MHPTSPNHPTPSCPTAFVINFSQKKKWKKYSWDPREWTGECTRECTGLENDQDNGLENVLKNNGLENELENGLENTLDNKQRLLYDSVHKIPSFEMLYWLVLW